MATTETKVSTARNDELPAYLQRMLSIDELFAKARNDRKQVNKLHTEAGILEMLARLDNDLSPENLHCDGEISHTAAMKKKAEIKRAWKYLEKKLGRTVQPEGGGW